MQESYNIQEIRNLYGLSQTEFAKKVRMSRELVSKIENGKCELKRPTLRKIEKFLERNPLANYAQDVNILGKASAFASDGESYFLQRREQKNETQLYWVPLVGIKAQAGYVKSYEQADFVEALEKYSLPPGVNPKGAEWTYFEVDGDSMEPTFQAGDIVLASLLPMEDWSDIKNYAVYVILTEQQLLVKRILRKSGNEWLLISDNEDVEAMTLNTEKIKQVWTFRRHIRSRVPQPREFEVRA